MTDERVTDLFARYGAALGAGDLPGISDCYAVPALVVADAMSIAVGDSADVEAAFAGAADAYRAKGLVGVEAVVRDIHRLTGALVLVAVDWQYANAAGEVEEGESYRYLLRVDEDVARICVVVPAGSSG